LIVHHRITTSSGILDAHTLGRLVTEGIFERSSRGNYIEARQYRRAIRELRAWQAFRERALGRSSDRRSTAVPSNSSRPRAKRPGGDPSCKFKCKNSPSAVPTDGGSSALTSDHANVCGKAQSRTLLSQSCPSSGKPIVHIERYPVRFHMRVRKPPSMALLVQKMKTLDASAVDHGLEPLLGEGQAAEYLGFYTTRFAGLRSRGGRPRYVRISSRAIRYRRCDLDAWIRERLH
jgi:predicted DNA-binding transcriptional regulator AlpA